MTSSAYKAETSSSDRPLPSKVASAVVPNNATKEEEATTAVANSSIPGGVTEENIQTGIANTNFPNTFQGERGGNAEDADLLAELRAISQKSSTDRFASSGDADTDPVASSEDNNVIKEQSDTSEKPWKKKKSSTTAPSSQLPPWKQKKTLVNNSGDVDVVVAAPSSPPSELTTKNAKDSSLTTDNTVATTVVEPVEQNMGITSNLPNAFKGERGGQAEDADLLAELRAISQKSSTDRFAVGTDKDEAGFAPPNDSPVVESTNQNHSSSSNRPSASQTLLQEAAPLNQSSDPVSRLGVAPSSSPADEINITLDGLDESLKSTNWQVRKASYSFLQERLKSLSKGPAPLNSSIVYASLDQTITQALKDKNAGALDAALTLSVTYAASCEGACTEDAANEMMTSLLKGAAFASPRSSTQTSTEELVLKLIEVSPKGSSSISNIFDLIKEHGLKSKKPKVVLFSAKLVLKSVETFGANSLPISILKASSESLIAHSDSKVREFGLKLLAEICRSLGSKAPLQSLVDKLKRAQQSQLDSLLEAQPAATIPSRQLRHKLGQPASTLTPEEALAALKKSEAENEAKRLENRPAVNLLQVLPKTCYKEKIKLPKWSEKVAALDALIEAGGEQPFKLCPPSVSVNYTPLIRELKDLLGHTHFAVCSKALAAMGMLAEGVGEELYPNMRPLLPTLVALFKDKKVIKAVSSCLDKMFANTLSFGHLLESKDSLPASLDEKKQKNALVRKNVLDYLARCVETSGTYGTQGGLHSQYAEDLSRLACEKLKDSDASVRKGATDVLLALLLSSKEDIVSVTESVTSSLQKSNPRAYKSLKQATFKGGETGEAKSSAKTSTEKGNRVAKQTTTKTTGPPKSRPGSVSSSASDECGGDDKLPSFEESIERLSSLSIAKWGDSIDDEGILAGIQCELFGGFIIVFRQLSSSIND